MNISITGSDVSDALRQHISEKMSRLERHLHKITQVHIALDVQKTRHLAEATVNHKGGQIHASADTEDMFDTIQALSEKLDRQALKFKEKSHDHGRGHADQGEE